MKSARRKFQSLEVAARPSSKDWKSAAVLRHTFGPLESPNARVLILGSMPGAASLRAGQYYAHPQNQFWSIMGDLFGAGRELPYPERLRTLMGRGIALWDVIEECVRPGSLDSGIVAASVKPNDIDGLLRRCPTIRTICFNGQAAAKLFHQHVVAPAGIDLVALPSTSPAHASMTLAEKCRRWRRVLRA